MASNLTTTGRVKRRLGLNNTNKDTFLDRLVVQVSEFVESKCNRIFEKDRYEEYIDGAEIYMPGYFSYVHVNNPPIKKLLGLHYLSDRQTVSDTGDESENVNLDNLNEISAPNRTWKDFSYYEVNDERGSILLQVPHGWKNVRIRYEGGFAKDFNNYEKNSKHEIPRDITELTERLIVKAYKKRAEEGLQSADFRDATRTYEGFLTAQDMKIINEYKVWHGLL